MKPYYEHAGITLYHGDCREVLPTLSSVDLAFTSPPYNLGNTTGGGMPHKKFGHYDPKAGMTARSGGGKWSGGRLAFGYGEHDDNMPHKEYVAWQKEVVTLCWGTLSETGAIFYNHKPRVFDGEVVTPPAYLPELPIRQISSGPAQAAPTSRRPSTARHTSGSSSSPRPTGVSSPRAPPASGTSGSCRRSPAQRTRRRSTWCCPRAPSRLPRRSSCSIVRRQRQTLRAAKDAGVLPSAIELSERRCELAVERLAQETLF